LQIPLALLRQWHTDLAALGGWARVIADITRQLDSDVAEDDAAYRDAAYCDAASPVPVSAEAGSTAATGRASREGDERRRFARVGLRRWVQIRDRVCSHPGCRSPAARSELDHTRQHGHGGPTVDANLAAACAHDHDLRDHGWRVIQPAPGHVIWISRTGHRYPVQPPPIIEPLGEPIIPTIPTTPTDVPEPDLPLPSTYEYADPWYEAPQPPPPPQPEPTKQPPPDPAQDIPPF
jgi:hypothetical protein